MAQETFLEKFSKRFLIFVLLGVLGVSIIVGYYEMDYASTLSSDLERVKQRLTSLEEKMTRTARYVSVGNITLYFEPYEENQTVPGTTITYLLGFATVTNLKNIVVRPITLTVFFTPNVTQIGNGELTFDYTPSQSLELASPALNKIDLPWGAFPVQLEGYLEGDVIFWDMTIEAVVYWMEEEVTKTTLNVRYRLTVSGE